MAKAKEELQTNNEVVLQNVTLDELQTFDFAWAEKILQEQDRYDGFKPFALPNNSEFEFVGGKLSKK